MSLDYFPESICQKRFREMITSRQATIIQEIQNVLKMNLNERDVIEEFISFVASSKSKTSFGSINLQDLLTELKRHIKK